MEHSTHTQFEPGCDECERAADDIAIMREVRTRMASDTGERLTLDELLETLGYTRADFEPPRIFGTQIAYTRRILKERFGRG